MKKYNILKSSVISGALILTFAGIISRFIGFYYKIFLSRAIGAEGLGMYQLIFPIFALFLAVTSSGIQTAISRCCASCQSERQARRFLLAGISITLTLSLPGMLLIRTKADWFCRIMMEGMNGTSLLYIMLWAIPFAGVHSYINGYYYGRKKAAIPAFSQLFEQIIRVLGVWLLMQIAAEQGRIPSASDAVWGILIGEIGSTCYCVTALAFSKKDKKKKRQHISSQNTLSLWKIYKNLCSLAIPLTLNRLAGSIFSAVEALLIPLSLQTFGYTASDALSVYGILTGMVFSTIMFPAVISNSLAVMLLPAISGASAQGNTALVNKTVRRTVQLCTILGFLCTFAFLGTGEWIGIRLFHNTLAGIYLKTLCWICPFVFLGSTLGSVLHGLGRATATLLINLASSAIRIAFIWLGIPAIGLKAYLWGMLVSQIFASVMSWLCIRSAVAVNHR
ncbi:MAG: polysaccharide biosynthesis protein [Clostridiales bacterium]|nr:polysaccharide biosynthesis protein [Clostridiales bacterium]